MKTATRITCHLAFLAIILASVAGMPRDLPGAEPKAQEPGELRGRISGYVVSSVTEEPIAGAYVGIGDFGDAGGANLERFRKQGIYASTETDKDGRFVLQGVAYLDNHPLVVTHPEYVRNDQLVSLRKDKPQPDIRIELKPAAKVNVKVTDASGNVLRGHFLIRLEDLDGRRFIPPGQNRHLSAFASSIWAEWSTTGAFSFTELDQGDYSIDAMRFTPPETVPESTSDWPDAAMRSIPSVTAYHGGISHLKLETGETKEVEIPPADYKTTMTIMIEIPESPFFKPDLPRYALVSRYPGLLMWDDGKTHGPEDHRLGRLLQRALFITAVSPEGTHTVQNLPPGVYAVFAGPHPLYMRGARAELTRGRETRVEFPWIEPDEMALVNLWTFNKQVKPAAKEYSAQQMCELLTETTKSSPRFKADPSIQNEKLTVSPEQVSIWDLLETIYLDKGWRLEEEGEKTLILRPGASSNQ